MKNLKIILFVLMFGLILNACKKDANTTPVPASQYPYKVRMTDAPGPYDAVYIDLQAVEVTGVNGKAVTLNVNAGIYNLLDFSNGMDTLIASGTLEVSAVEQIRLILGTNNSVVIDSVSYPLSTPSADQSGLKLQVHQTLQAGVTYSVLVDFDANKSIVDEGNGSYKLKPVLRTIETATSGSIKGKILPSGISAVVTATSSTNITYSTNVSANGDFILMGLPADTYVLTITPSKPLNVATIGNVVVVIGSTTDVGIINL